jgi:hypothetical protein
MHPSAPPGLPCPVCGTPAAGPAAAPCPTCGLPAVGQAALVVARIGATLTELARDRDALLATLRAAAPGHPMSAPVPPPAPLPAVFPAPAAPVPPVPPPTAPPAPPRRLSPQQVLLGLGALLLVAGTVAFVALAWTRLGLAFQATVVALVTAAACATSAWSARRGLRATEEALAAAGAALLAVDLGAAYAKGLLGIDGVPARFWAAVACAVVVLVAVPLGRLTRTTAAWPLVALLAVHPVPFLLMPPAVLGGPAGVAAALALAAVDVRLVRRLRAVLVPAAVGLAGLGALTAAGWGIAVAAWSEAPQSWTATAVLAVGAAGTLPLLRGPGPVPLLPRPGGAAAGGAAVVGLALACSLDTAGAPGQVTAGALGIALLTVAVPLAGVPVAAAALVAGGTALAVGGIELLVSADRLPPLSLVVLAATVPAVLAAALLPRLRLLAAVGALAAPVLAVLTARAGGWLSAAGAGLLLALVAAAALAAAAVRARRPEEAVVAAGAAVAAVLGAGTTAAAGAWGQVGLQLAVAGAAAGCYALAARRTWVAALALADLAAAAWTALAGARVETLEAYTIPAAVALLLLGLPRLLTRGPSWAAEGPAVAVALAPSAFLAVTAPTAARLGLVVAAAVALTVAGTAAHRQAPFVLGAACLAFTVLGRLVPFTPLLPRWITLTAAGLVLLLVGATYERRRQQAREAVAWVVQMR